MCKSCRRLHDADADKGEAKLFSLPPPSHNSSEGWSWNSGNPVRGAHFKYQIESCPEYFGVKYETTFSLCFRHPNIMFLFPAMAGVVTGQLDR